MEIFIKDIKFGPRFRGEGLDGNFVNRLALDIKERGLLHPIGVNKDNELIFGYCRIAAHQQLGKNKIEARVFDISGNDLRDAEISENLIRLNHTPSEMVEIKKFYYEQERKAAAAREKAGSTYAPSGKLPPGRSRDILAKMAGVSYKTMEKMEEVYDAAKINPQGIMQQLDSGNIKAFKASRLVQTIKSMDLAIAEAKSQYDTEGIEKLGIGLVFSIQTYLGDFQKIAPDRVKSDSVQLIFTDPFYDEKSVPIYIDLAKLAKRVLKDGGSIVVYGNNDFIPHIITAMVRADLGGLHYKHTFAVELEGPFAPGWPNVTIAWKPLLWFYKEDKPIVQGRIRDLIKSKRAKGKDWSPNKQSTIEAKHMIEKLTVESEYVLDPMMGEGTTAIAALQLKRRFIGIEKDSQQLKIAKSNIKKAISVIS